MGAIWKEAVLAGHRSSSNSSSSSHDMIICSALNYCVAGLSVLHFTKLDRNRRHIESIDVKCDVKSIVEGAVWHFCYQISRVCNI